MDTWLGQESGSAIRCKGGLGILAFSESVYSDDGVCECICELESVPIYYTITTYGGIT